MKYRHTDGKLFLWSCLAAAYVSFLPLVRAADDDDIQARLARMPRPWTQKVHRITLKEYEATLEYWADKYPQTLTVERVGVSAEGMRIYLLKITDPAVDDDDKQICLVTSLH
ncbi:MAG: M14 family zinc carboxypeptidase, partial [Pirellulaceae bacterium]